MLCSIESDTSEFVHQNLATTKKNSLSGNLIFSFHSVNDINGFALTMIAMHLYSVSTILMQSAKKAEMSTHSLLVDIFGWKPMDSHN